MQTFALPSDNIDLTDALIVLSLTTSIRKRRRRLVGLFLAIRVYNVISDRIPQLRVTSKRSLPRKLMFRTSQLEARDPSLGEDTAFMSG